MKTYNKEQFINCENITGYFMEIGTTYKDAKKELKEQGVWDEWLELFTINQYNTLKMDEEFVERIQNKMDNNTSINNICLMRPYNYKAIEKYLTELDYEPKTGLDEDDWETIKENIDDDYIAKRKKWFEDYKALSLSTQEFKSMNEPLLEIAYQGFEGFKHRGIEIAIEETYESKAVSKKEIVKTLGVIKAKELFPKLFEPKTNFKVKYNYDNMA